MFDLDNISAFPGLDTQNMLAEIDNLPDQLRAAWELGLRQPLPAMSGIRQVLVSGMGGSAIGADLLAAAVAGQARLPVTVHRDYGLPSWASGPETLVVASSHSGNTEETLSGFQQAQERGCRTLAVTTGGKLSARAQAANSPVWTFSHTGQPRAAVGFSFGLLLAALWKLGLIPDPEADLLGAVAAMKSQQPSLQAGTPAPLNPAKRMAGQLVDRWVTVMAADFLAPVARRWKGQVSELAKAWAQFEFLPEANHNTLAGALQPEALLPRLIVLFIQAPGNHPRNQKRIELTRKAFMLEGLNTDVITPPGETLLAQMWTALHFGDYMGYYLALLYGSDPTPVEALEAFKNELTQ